VSRHAPLLGLAAALLLGLSGTPALAGPTAARPPATVNSNRTWPLESALSRVTVPADSAWKADRSYGFSDSLVTLHHQRGDRLMEMAARTWRARKYSADKKYPRALADLDTIWKFSLATHDSSGIMRVLTIRGNGYLMLGDHEQTRAWNEKSIVVGRRAGFTTMEGFAHRAIGMFDKNSGHYPEAERHLKDAIRLIPVERFEYRHSRFLLAEVYNRTGRHDEARAMFLELHDLARQKRDRWTMAATLNDLGVLEYGEGDAALADQYWERAAVQFDSIEVDGSGVSARTNRAHALIHLGKTDEARTLLNRLAETSRPFPDLTTLLAVINELAHLDYFTERYEQAERGFRAVRAAAVDDVMAQFSASSDLAALLRDTGRLAESEALLDSLLAPDQRERYLRDDLALAHSERCATRRMRGRTKEALADARTAELLARTGRKDGSIYWLQTAIELGRTQRAAGRPDSAVIVLRGAAAFWERWRADISDLEWRERSGAGVAELFSEYGLALLDPRRGGSQVSRARQAFDALQTFQARTLEERMHGVGLAGRGMKSRIGADSLRRSVLRPGELLVDVVSTPDTSFAFLLSKVGIEARFLPGSDRLSRLYRDWRDATLGGADAAVAERGLLRLSQELLTPIAEPVRTARLVILTGGGPLALWPVGALTLPGETTPLCETRELFAVPSATLLAALRNQSRSARATGLLAVGRTSDAQGRELPGAERELRAVRDRFTGAEVRMNKGDKALADLVGDLPRWDVLHFAAHAEAETGSPWRSGFLLGKGTGDDAYLRASGIAQMRLKARLAVLSGCQSAGVTTLSGEGALGLASAFLCSGTASVVATLWPVEDRVAQQFMSEFYNALARGSSVAAAVRTSQRALRARPETANPRDWAAFVASGEAGTKVQLQLRAGSAVGLTP
jgi:tetratricopeptide (TPR) repeat protein